MGGRGASSGIKEKSGIGLLQGEVAKASTNMLHKVYRELSKKDVSKMSNEEKMVRAVTIDELSKRGRIIYDARTGEHVLSNDNNIVNTEDRSYRVRNVKRTTVQAVSGAEREVYMGDVSFYAGGKWNPVKNIQKIIQISAEYKKRKK